MLTSPLRWVVEDCKAGARADTSALIETVNTVQVIPAIRHPFTAPAEMMDELRVGLRHRIVGRGLLTFPSATATTCVDATAATDAEHSTGVQRQWRSQPFKSQ